MPLKILTYSQVFQIIIMLSRSNNSFALFALALMLEIRSNDFERTVVKF